MVLLLQVPVLVIQAFDFRFECSNLREGSQVNRLLRFQLLKVPFLEFQAVDSRFGCSLLERDRSVHKVLQRAILVTFQVYIALFQVYGARSHTAGGNDAFHSLISPDIHSRFHRKASGQEQDLYLVFIGLEISQRSNNIELTSYQSALNC